MMTREQLLLLTTRQLDAMIEHWPSTDVIVRDGDVTLRTVYNGSWVVDIKRWGRLGDHFEFLLETSHRGVVWPLSNVHPAGCNSRGLRYMVRWNRPQRGEEDPEQRCPVIPL